MPVQADANDADLFQIVLPAGASNQEVALKQQFDSFAFALGDKRALPGYRPLLRRLQDAARRAFDGAGGAAPDPNSAQFALGAIDTQLKLLDARPGRFMVTLPAANDRDIAFGLIPAPTPVPTDQLELKSDIESTLTTLQVVLKGNNPGSAARFQEYRSKLFSLAQVGLQPSSDVKAGRQALNALNAEILTREGPRVKNGYMKTLGAWAIAFAVLAAIVYGMAGVPELSDSLLGHLRNFGTLWVGTMIGAWLSFGIRRAILNLTDLGNLESDMVEPAVRLVFTGLIAVSIGFIFMTGMVSVAIGGLQSANLLVHGSQAFLIGILMGVSEQALPGALTRRAAQFVSEVGGTASS
jgi:hypothetical protein